MVKSFSKHVGGHFFHSVVINLDWLVFIELAEVVVVSNVDRFCSRMKNVILDEGCSRDAVAVC